MIPLLLRSSTRRGTITFTCFSQSMISTASLRITTPAVQQHDEFHPGYLNSTGLGNTTSFRTEWLQPDCTRLITFWQHRYVLFVLRTFSQLVAECRVGSDDEDG